MDALAAHELPPGKIVVPCCGPGHELPLLLQRLPGRELDASDLSPRMVELAKEHGPARVADAQELDAREAAAVFSCFGLQQLPRPDEGLASWARCLARGGVLSVMLWPPEPRDEAFGLIRKIVRERGSTSDPSWEKRLVPALEGLAAVLEDRLVEEEMRHESARAFWDALTLSGPLRALVLRATPAFVEGVRDAFLAAMPKGELVHRPVARLIVARRR